MTLLAANLMSLRISCLPAVTKHKHATCNRHTHTHTHTRNRKATCAESKAHKATQSNTHGNTKHRTPHSTQHRTATHNHKATKTPHTHIAKQRLMFSHLGCGLLWWLSCEGPCSGLPPQLRESAKAGGEWNWMPCERGCSSGRNSPDLRIDLKQQGSLCFPVNITPTKRRLTFNWQAKGDV